MDRIDAFDDSRWTEVKYINGYAVFMGYLMMGVRGLGMLVITWTTVVLLGGFVSILGKKDFWCLTGITLVQTAGVFNFLLEETLSDFVRSWWGLLGAAAVTLSKPFRKAKGKHSKKKRKRKGIMTLGLVLTFVLSAIQALVLVIILCPVAVLYIFGMYISAGVGLWRLIEHDFGNINESANLKPALEVLYSLALTQGLLFGYKTIHYFGAKSGLPEFVAATIGTTGSVTHCRVDERLISDYLEGTVAGCEKDPAFAGGRNLVTYGMELMVEAKSKDGFIAGIRVLGALLDGYFFINRTELAKNLLLRSASWTHVIQRLLVILGPRSPYNREIRGNAARIVVLVAGGIRLEQFPGGIQCISSLLDTFEEYSWVPEDYKRPNGLPKEYEKEWLLEKEERSYVLYGKRAKSRILKYILFLKEKVYGKGTDSTVNSMPPERSSDILNYYERLVLQGLFILQKLAIREENCKVISNMEGLLLKIKAPLISNQQHRDHNDVWSTVADASLVLIRQLMATPGKTGIKLQHKIIGNKKAFISTLQSIVECQNCTLSLKRQSVQILLDLSVHPSSITNSESSSQCMVRPFTWILLHIFLLLDDRLDDRKMCGSIHWKKKLSDIRRLAGEKLSNLFFPNIELSAMLLLQNGASITSLLLSVRIVVGDLTEALIFARSISIRLCAAEILIHLLNYYHKDDEYRKELKKAMVDVMPQVLTEVLDYGSTKVGVPDVTEANNVQSSSQDIIDLESGDFPNGNAEENTSSQQQRGVQPEEKKLREVLVRLCGGGVPFPWYQSDTDLTHRLDEVAEKVCSKQGKPVENFKELVDEAQKLLNKLEKEEE